METTFEEVPIVIGIPRNSVKVDITVKVMVDDKLKTAEKHLTVGDIMDLRTDFQKFIGDDWDALYVLTEEARKGIEKGRL